MSQAIRAAENAIMTINSRVSATSLSHTTYCVLVMRGPNGLASIIAAAGESARSIPEPLITAIESATGIATIGAVAPTSGTHGWHVNDAERQAIFIWSQGYQPNGYSIEHVMATRAICASCAAFLGNQGLRTYGVSAGRAQAAAASSSSASSSSTSSSSTWGKH